MQTIEPITGSLSREDLNKEAIDPTEIDTQTDLSQFVAQTVIHYQMSWDILILNTFINFNKKCSL